jgi:uncharacterized Fe-S cluster-containing protein
MKTRKIEVSKEGFTGFIEVELLSYPQRLRLLSSLKYKISDGEVKTTDETFEMIAKQVEALMAHTKAVEIKHGDQTFTSLEELGMYNEGAPLLTELSAEFMRGASLGKA